MTYIDNLIFHYLGGITLAALKMWPKAEELFEICVTAPGIVPSAIQLEALKKMRLVQLISRGKTEVLPKYALPSLTRLLKITPYNAFVNAYPHNIDALKEIARKERTLFATVCSDTSLPVMILTGYVGEKPWVNQSSNRACTTMGTQKAYWHLRHTESD